MKPTKYQQTIEATIKQAAATPGFKAAIRRHFIRVTGEDIQRQAVDRWLSDDKESRIVPNANTAEHLLKAISLAQRQLRRRENKV